MQFSLQRLIYLFKLQLANNRKRYLLGTLALAGILAILMLYNIYMQQAGLEYHTQEAIFLPVLFIGMAVFTASIFSQFSNKRQRVQAMLLPVSALERLVLAVMLIMVFFPVAFCCVYFPVGYCMHLIDRMMPQHEGKFWLPPGNMIVDYLQAFCIAATFAILCGSWLRKQALVKGIVIATISFVGFLSIARLAGAVIIDGAPQPDISKIAALQQPHYAVVKSLKYGDGGFLGTVRLKMLDQQQQELYTLGSLEVAQNTAFNFFIDGVFNLMPFFFLYVAFLKLKEKEL